MDVYDEVEKMKDSPLTDADKTEIKLRSEYAKVWLNKYADSKFIFELQKELPKSSEKLSDVQTKALGLLADKIDSVLSIDGDTLHTLIHEVKEESKLTPQEFFGAIYTVFLGKESGPKIGWFLSSLDKEFASSRLRLIK